MLQYFTINEEYFKKIIVDVLGDLHLGMQLVLYSKSMLQCGLINGVSLYFRGLHYLQCKYIPSFR
jgi:hypothetical protein